MRRLPPPSTLFPYTTLFRSRADGSPLYTLAVAVDDVLMKITHVVRGEDLLSSTPRQITVYRAMGVPEQDFPARSEEHTSELQSRRDLVCRLLLEKKNY